MDKVARLRQQVMQYCKHHALFHKNERILVAVSGGLDSVCLLDVLDNISKEFGIQLGIAHVHHGIRGDAAEGDLQFVKGLAETAGLPFFPVRVDVPSFARKHKLSLEDSARILRYDALNDISVKNSFDKTAVAHTLDDQAETVLLNFVRGAGAMGLAGMPPLHGKIVRPLLKVRRRALESYAQERNIEHRQDETNLDTYYTRNRIRLQLIPRIESDFDTDFKAVLYRTSEVFSEIEAYLQMVGKEAFKSLVSLQKKNQIVLEIQAFLDYFSIVQKYALIEAFDRIGVARKALTYRILTELVDAVASRRIGRRVDVCKDAYLLIDHDGVSIGRTTNERLSSKEFDLLEDSEITWGTFQLRWSILDCDWSLEFSEGGQIEFLDFDKTGSQLRIRGTEPGDRFVPLNFSGRKTVSNFFTDRKIPHRLRKATPILLAKNEIIWVCGYCIDDRFKISDKTRRVLKLEITAHENGV
jgi:tRNA(Ile)-lysidine synthase